MRLRDTQRQKVYNWENTTFAGKHGETLTLNECTALVHKALRRYGIRSTVPVKDGRGHRWARGGSHEIELPKWARNPVVVIHEAAHAVVDFLERRHDVQVAAHGPEFVRVYVSLLDVFGVKPKDPAKQGINIASLARGAGLKVAPPGGWVPMTTTVYRQWEAALTARATALAAVAKAEEEMRLTGDAYLGSSRRALLDAKAATEARRARGRRQAALHGFATRPNEDDYTAGAVIKDATGGDV